MGDVKQLWTRRDSAQIEPGFVRSTVAVTIHQMQLGFAEELALPQNNDPHRQEFIKGLTAALPEAKRRLTDAMELAVLGRHCDPHQPLSQPAEKALLPKNSLELKRRIDRMQSSVVAQFEMLDLPDVAEDMRAGVRSMYHDGLFQLIAARLCQTAAQQLGYTPPGR